MLLLLAALFGLVMSLLKASLRCGVKGGRFEEFCGNLNNYTPCSPRVINYICGKGFLILEPSTDKGWWGERREKKKTKYKEALIKPFLTDLGCMQTCRVISFACRSAWRSCTEDMKDLK